MNGKRERRKEGKVVFFDKFLLFHTRSRNMVYVWKECNNTTWQFYLVSEWKSSIAGKFKISFLSRHMGLID